MRACAKKYASTAVYKKILRACKLHLFIVPDRTVRLPAESGRKTGVPCRFHGAREKIPDGRKLTVWKMRKEKKNVLQVSAWFTTSSPWAISHDQTVLSATPVYRSNVYCEDIFFFYADKTCARVKKRLCPLNDTERDLPANIDPRASSLFQTVFATPTTVFVFS